MAEGRAEPMMALTAPARQPIDKHDMLRSHPVFGQCAEPLLRRLGTYATVRRVPKGTVIFSKDDVGAGLFAVLSGTVKISLPSADGREALLNLIQPGELFGEIALLDGRSRTADAVAMTDCELMVIDRRDFIPFVRNEPDLALKLIEVLCGRLRWASEHFAEVLFLDLPGRLAKTLLRLSEQEDKRGARRMVKITQRELSQLIGMSRESTNKQLRMWERSGWIRLERGGIAVLSAPALEQIATADPDRHLP